MGGSIRTESATVPDAAPRQHECGPVCGDCKCGDSCAWKKRDATRQTMFDVVKAHQKQLVQRQTPPVDTTGRNAFYCSDCDGFILCANTRHKVGMRCYGSQRSHCAECQYDDAVKEDTL